MSAQQRLHVVVLVSGQGSNLRALQQAIVEGRCAARIVGVSSDRSTAPALAWAESQGLPTRAVPWRGQAEREAWQHDLMATVAAWQPELVVLAGFMRILAPAFVDRFAPALINVHPSLLPAFRGAHAVAEALAAGVERSGCTVHRVDHGVDSGPILAQAAVPVLPGDDVASLQRRIQAEEHRLLPQVVQALALGRYPSS